jgi:excisionase family DNA binding protein
MMSNGRVWMTRSQAADYLGLKAKTLANWVSVGKGPRFKKPGKIVLYRREELDKFIERNGKI